MTWPGRLGSGTGRLSLWCVPRSFGPQKRVLHESIHSAGTADGSIAVGTTIHPTGDHGVNSARCHAHPARWAGTGRDTALKILLGCGVLSSVVYIVAEMYAWTLYPGYSPVSGVQRTAGRRCADEALHGRGRGRPVQPAGGCPRRGYLDFLPEARDITAALVMLYAVTSYLGGTVFQMDPRGTQDSVRTMLHERATAIMVVSMLLAMGFGAFLHGKWFSVYSMAPCSPSCSFRLRRSSRHPCSRQISRRRGWESSSASASTPGCFPWPALDTGMKSCTSATPSGHEEARDENVGVGQVEESCFEVH